MTNAVQDMGMCRSCGKFFDKKICALSDERPQRSEILVADSSSSLLTDNGDGTVTDNKACLTWQKDDDGKRRNWTEAMNYAKSISVGGHSDWRLPSKEELRSLCVKTGSRKNDAGDGARVYWSSTVNPASSEEAYVIAFDSRGNGFSEYKKDEWYVLCVRNGSKPQTPPSTPQSQPHAAAPAHPAARTQTPKASNKKWWEFWK